MAEKSIDVEYAETAGDALRGDWGLFTDGNITAEQMATSVDDAARVIDWLFKHWSACGEALNAVTAAGIRRELRSNPWNHEDIQDYVNELLERSPESWDDDAAGCAIALRYLRHLEAEVERLGGCRRPWCRWKDDEPEPCDHGYLADELGPTSPTRITIDLPTPAHIVSDRGFVHVEGRDLSERSHADRAMVSVDGEDLTVREAEEWALSILWLVREHYQGDGLASEVDRG